MKSKCLLFFCLVARLGATISYVQNAWAYGGSGCSSQTLAYSSNVTAGNLLVTIPGSNTGPTIGISDSQSNTETQIGTSCPARCIYMFWAIAGSSAADTVTYTLSPSSRCVMELREYHATKGWPSNPLDKVTTGGPGTATSPTVNQSVTTVDTNDLVVAGMYIDSGVSWSSTGSGWGHVNAPQASTPNTVVMDQLNVAPGAYGSEGSASGNTSWGAVVAGFVEQGGGIGMPSVL